MDEHEISAYFDRLKEGELKQLEVGKEEFMLFATVLVKRPDFKHFRGTAERGGSVRYEYMAEPRS